MKNRAAKRHNSRVGQVSAESVPVAEAARLLGVSPRTVKHMCAAGQLRSFRTAGGHVRVRKGDSERFREGQAGPAPAPVSSVLQNRRERIEELGLEAQELRAKREIEKLREEDAEAGRRRAAAAHGQELEHKRAIEESRLQVARDAEQRRREREQALAERKRREWLDRWAAWAVSALPEQAPAEMRIAVYQGVEGALAKSNLGPEQSEAIIQGFAVAAVDKALKPWKHQKQVEQAIQEARTQLPAIARRFFEPTQWEVRAMQAARAAISQLSSDAAFEEMRAAAVQAGKQIAKEYEAEQARARAEAQQQQRERYKKFLVDIGVGHVSLYLSKLHSDGEIWDEDVQRKSELENAVRKAVEDRFTGEESFDEAQRLCRDVVDTKLGQN